MWLLELSVCCSWQDNLANCLTSSQAAGAKVSDNRKARNVGAACRTRLSSVPNLADQGSALRSRNVRPARLACLHSPLNRLKTRNEARGTRNALAIWNTMSSPEVRAGVAQTVERRIRNA